MSIVYLGTCMIAAKYLEEAKVIWDKFSPKQSSHFTLGLHDSKKGKSQFEINMPEMAC